MKFARLRAVTLKFYPIVYRTLPSYCSTKESRHVDASTRRMLRGNAIEIIFQEEHVEWGPRENPTFPRPYSSRATRISLFARVRRIVTRIMVIVRLGKLEGNRGPIISPGISRRCYTVWSFTLLLLFQLSLYPWTGAAFHHWTRAIFPSSRTVFSFPSLPFVAFLRKSPRKMSRVAGVSIAGFLASATRGFALFISGTTVAVTELFNDPTTRARV